MARDTSYNFETRSSIDVDPNNLTVAQSGTQHQDPLQGTQSYGFQDPSLPFNQSDGFSAEQFPNQGTGGGYSLDPITGGSSTLPPHMMLIVFIGGLLALEVFRKK